VCLVFQANLVHQAELERWGPRVSRVLGEEEDRKDTEVKWDYQAGREIKERKVKLEQRDRQGCLELKESLDLSDLSV